MKTAYLAAVALIVLAGPAAAQTAQRSQNEAISGAQSNVYMNNPDKVRNRIETNPGIGGPGLTTSDGTCAGSVGGGLSIVGLGLTLGKTYEMEACVRHKEAVFLEQKGYSGASTARFCMNKKVDEAMWLAGTPCPQSQGRYQQATSSQNAAPSVNRAKFSSLPSGTRYSTDGGKTWKVKR